MVWTSCDLASGDSTAILNANSTFPPTVRHRFEYAEEDVVEGDVAVESEVQSDDLDAILSRNGFSRRDVINARVDSVRIERVSAPSLRNVELFLGRDGPRVASVQFPSEGRSTIVDDTRRTVVRAVQDGAEGLDGRFELETPGAGVVRARVYYRLEVEGV
ncbi:hypothetical protein [Salinibacter altiplanensis]|uniref:hypothetical protein n=1 Tax=Salinibacter altiplanensis TaxID=1803181 RepID=UPI001E656329|nr:hypothetical protein [Salinibacter altiplanensis]